MRALLQLRVQREERALSGDGVCRGENQLEEKLRTSVGRLTDETAAEIGIQISDTFRYLHCRNPRVIYRDLNSKLLKTVESMNRDHPIARVSLNFGPRELY